MGEDTKGHVWNSLEVAKLVVGASTSIALALLGGVITWQGRAIDDRRHVEDTNRDDRLRREAVDRDTANKLLELRHSAELQAAARSYDQRVRNEARIQEVRVRQQSAELQRYTMEVQKRSELWDKIGPLLAQIHAQAAIRSTAAYGPAATLGDRIPDEQVRAKLIEVTSDAIAYRPYFSEKFFDALRTYISTAELATQGYPDRSKASDDAPEDFEFEQLLRLAYVEMALAPGSLSKSTEGYRSAP